MRVELRPSHMPLPKEDENTMTKILVPIDGTESALNALRHALTVEADIEIINVQPKAGMTALRLHMKQHDIYNMQQQRGESMLAGARKVLDEAGRHYRAQVLIGEPAVKIVRVAKARGVDQIVMGTRGMTALGNLALGSTATKVVHLSHVPVTLVNDRCVTPTSFPAGRDRYAACFKR